MPILTTYEDDDIWVFDKPSGISMLRDRSGAQDLWSQISARTAKPYLIHRLDKGTSGVLIVAKNPATQKKLTRAFHAREVTKYYVARVSGTPPAGTHIVDLPLCKGRKSRYRVAGERADISLNDQRFTVAQNRQGVDAQTMFRRFKVIGNDAIILLHPATGRTHQLRVHLAWLGWPIVGDHLYHGADAERLLLHAHYLKVPGWQPFKLKLPESFYA